jgi:hypothetical protein
MARAVNEARFLETLDAVLPHGLPPSAAGAQRSMGV